MLRRLVATPSTAAFRAGMAVSTTSITSNSTGTTSSLCCSDQRRSFIKQLKQMWNDDEDVLLREDDRSPGSKYYNNPEGGGAAPSGGQKFVHKVDKVTKMTYRTAPDFEPVMMRFFNDGVDSEFKDELRDYIKKNPTAFLYSNCDKERAHNHTMAKLKHLCSKGFVSVAQVNTTPRVFLSLYEVAATLDVQMAMSLSSHFSLFANIIAVHGQPHHHQWVLGDVDRMRTVGCLALNEVLADTPPIHTKAALDFNRDEFTITSRTAGDNKFGVVNAMSAEWCLVCAELEVGVEVHGPQLFLVRIRNAMGELAEGVTVSSVGDTNGLDGAGMGVIRFNNFRCERRCMIMSDVRVTDSGTFEKVANGKDPFTSLATFNRLSTAATALGLAKRLTADLVHYSANKVVIGPFNKRDYPLLGFHHIQARVASLVSKLYVFNAIYHRVTSIFCKPHQEYSEEDVVRLILINSHLLDLCKELADFGADVVGPHAVVQSNNLAQAAAYSAFGYEGWDRSHLKRGVGVAIVQGKMGSKSKFSGAVSWLPGGTLRRMFGTPLFTPRSLELGRFQVLFSNRQVHLRAKLALALAREAIYGPEEEFHYIHCEQFRATESLVSSYSDLMAVDTMLQEATACMDPQNRRMLRDIGWHYVVNRLEEDLSWFLEEKWLSPRFGRGVHKSLDLMTNNMSRQAVPLMEALSIPAEFRTSPIGNDLSVVYGLGATPATVDDKEASKKQ